MNQWQPVGIVTYPYPSRASDSIVESHTGIILSVNELLARYNFLISIQPSVQPTGANDPKPASIKPGG